MIRAFAGCAKTTTLQMLCEALPKDLPILYLVFNVKNKKEAEKRFPSNVTVMTMNGLGHRAWGRAMGARLTIDERKLGKLVTAAFEAERFSEGPETWNLTRELVTAAMQAGLVPSDFAPRKGLTEDNAESWGDLADDIPIYDREERAQAIHFARAALVASVKQSFVGTISFDDQIYCSAMFGGVFPRFGTVLVDEAQDQSKMNIRMINRCAAGRLIIVGDEKQGIYLWRGAEANAMEQIRALRTEWLDLTLPETFRCAKLIVERQQKHAPGFRAYSANKEGSFHILPEPEPTLEGLDFVKPETWKWLDVEKRSPCKQLPEQAILCRNNAPLLSMAFKLLRSGTPCVMLGRDIGKGLIALAKKLMPLDDIPAATCAMLINEWRNSEASLAKANGKDAKIAGIEDRAECLLAVLDSASVKTSGELRSALERLFARDTGRVTLSTIHRAKGLEWDVVLHLDPFRIPSRFAQGNPAQLQQEMNLKYVAETRTKSVLIEANLEDFAT